MATKRSKEHTVKERLFVRRLHMAIITDQRFYRAPSKIYGKGGLCIELLEAYGEVFDVTVFARVFSDGAQVSAGDEFVLCPNVNLIAVPRWDTMEIISKASAISRFFRANLHGFDVAVLRVGGISPLLSFDTCIRNQIPYIVHRIGEPSNRYEIGTKVRGSTLAKVATGLARPIIRVRTARMEAHASYRTAVSKTLARQLYDADLAVADTKLVSINKKAIRSKPGVPFTILFVGRLVDVKNPQTILLAASILKSKLEHIRVVFVGEGPLDEALKGQSTSLGLDAQVEFKGYVGNSGELWNEYKEADVLVLPSHSEGLPLVIIEAMSMGLPVIATDVGGVSELVINNETGFLLEHADPNRIADAVLHLAFSRDDFYRKLSFGALQKACGYTTHEQVKVMAEIVQLALK